MKCSNHLTKWSISAGVHGTVYLDGAVLLDIEKGLCYSLNVVGGRVWQVFEGGNGNSSVEDIVENLAREFKEVSREQLTIDAERCVQDLESKGLIRAATQSPRARPSKTKR